MANNKVRHYRTKEVGKVPLASKLLEGEIAINLADAKIYTNVDGRIVTIGHGAEATIDGNNTWTGTVKANKVVSDSAPTKKAELTRKDYVDAGDKLNADMSHALDSLKVNKDGDTMTGTLRVPVVISNEITSNNYINAGGSAGVTIRTSSAATRPMILWNFSSDNYENGLQFTDNNTWLGEIGTRKALRPANQSKTELKINGCITSTNNSESFRINYGNYGTFWRNDGASLYLMQTNRGDSDGTFNDIRPLRLNLESGDISLHTTTIQNVKGKNWIGIGAAVTPNEDSLGVAGLGTFVAVGDSDTGIGQRGDGNLDLVANNVAALKITSGRVLTTKAFTAQVQDSNGKIVMPSASNAILTVDGSGEPNKTTNGVTMLCYNIDDKYSHYFRGNGNFVVNMPYATFDKDIFVGGSINPAQLNMRGSINTTATPQGTYKWDDLSTSANNGAMSFLRRFRSQGNDSIFHETVHGGNVQISTGLNAGQMPLWGYNNNAFILNKQLFFPKGTANSALDCSIKAWGDGASRQTVVEFGDATSYFFYAQRHSTTGVEMLVNGSLKTAGTTTAANLVSTNNITSAIDITAARNVRANGAIYWGSNGAWAAQDGNIYGTQWGRFVGHSGQLAWLGGALDAVNAKASNTSDIRLKKNLEKIESATDKIQKLTGYTYDKATFIGSEESYRDAGVIAQEVQAVLPEAVNIIDLNDTPTLAVSPSAMIALLVESTKEQAEKLEKQNQLIEELMKRISKLEK